MRNTPAGPHILLVNPWIHDFAAYDFWAKPYGLLSLAAVLRDHGLRISYIDCLDRFHPKAPRSNPHARYGCGPYRKRSIAHPRGLERLARTYSRYGIEPAWFREDLAALDKPDLILVTSSMTYWYPGVFETIQILKSAYPEVPLILGGIYARLYPDHAGANSGADEIVTDRGESLLALVQRHSGFAPAPRYDLADWTAWPYPALDLQHGLSYVPLLTSRGCPFCCAYCASRYLEPEMVRRPPEMVVQEIAYWHQRYGAVDFAFYDDALLVDAQSHALPMLEGIIRLQRPIRLHTPNAIHIRAIAPESAKLMKAAGFQTLRLGLETTAFASRSGLDAKVTQVEFARAVGWLKAAGFAANQIGAYLLVGLPGQSADGVAASIEVVKTAGITPVLAYYTPIAHSPLWPEAVAASRYDLEADPVFTNNAILPCQQEAFSWPALSRLKQLVRTTPGCS
jgi:radical SAM superfamily enzyme YgiQ (UPF0313 family)